MHVRTRAARAYVPFGALLLGLGTALVPWAPASAATEGTVVDDNVNIRSGPGTDHGVVGTLNEGDTVSIACADEGTTHTGPSGPTNLWNKLDDGTWISDAWVTAPPVEACSDTPPPSGGDRISLDEVIGGDAAASVSQEFGVTEFSQANCWMYEYAVEYGLEECSHTGVDYAMGYGSQLLSPVDGTVTRAGGTGYFCDDVDGAGCGPGQGELRIALADGDEVILGHMSSIEVAEGADVTAGQPVGASGYVPGPHLHLEWRTPDSSTPSGWRIVDPRTELD